jgi:hypothetical protein
MLNAHTQCYKFAWARLTARWPFVVVAAPSESGTAADFLQQYIKVHRLVLWTCKPPCSGTRPALGVNNKCIRPRTFEQRD